MKPPVGLLCALVLALVAASAMYYASGTLVPSLVLWFVLATAIGVVLARRSALVLAAVPYPVQAGVGLLTGRYAFLGELWELLFAATVLVGLVGVAAGALLARVLRRRGASPAP